MARSRSVRGEVPDTEEATEMLEEQQVDSLLTPAEVAALFRVNPKTVTRWARAGKITAIRTLGGHRRYRATEIQRCLQQMELAEQ
jgi:excisionase family DNA binding protein